MLIFLVLFVIKMYLLYNFMAINSLLFIIQILNEHKLYKLIAVSLQLFIHYASRQIVYTCGYFVKICVRWYICVT